MRYLKNTVLRVIILKERFCVPRRKGTVIMFFKRSSNGRKKTPKAVVFVDYEHWFYSLNNLHHQKPNVREWREELSKQFDIDEMYFFADFNDPALQGEVSGIREVTNFIIETGTVSKTKDFTDFIMLDHIYQTAMTRDDIDVYVIFSGDGHFASVVRFLTSKRKKRVAIYGVRDAVSMQLKNSEATVTELPAMDESLRGYYYSILESLSELEKRKLVGRKRYATHKATAEAVAERYSLPRDKVSSAISMMMTEGYIEQRIEKVKGKDLKVIRVNWKKAADSGIWY